MVDQIKPLIDTLAALGLASGVQRSAPIYALVSATHMLGIALLIGPIFLADLRLLGRLRALDASAITILRRTAMVGIVIAVLAGVLLLSAKPAEYAANPVVWIKFGVIAIAIVNALRFELLWRRRGSALLDGGGGVSAAFSIVIWLSALLLGRWIAFV